MTELRKVEFFKLSRQIQDRFVGSAGNVFAPLPMVFTHVTPKTPLYWAGGSLASLLALIIVARVGYGDLDSSLSAHGFVGCLVYILLAASVVACAVRAVHLRKRITSLPYRPGIYVFPMCLVDARKETFTVIDMTALAVGNVVQSPTAKVFLSFSGGQKYEIPVENAAAGEKALASITSSRDEVRAAIAREDPGELITLDPLHQPRFSSPVAPRDAYGAFAPKWAKLFFAIGLGAGVVVGPITWLLRNSGSDTKMYKTAVANNDVGSYKLYLTHGKSHKDDVTDILLPRAELREAEKPGTVDALLAYVAAHPDSKIKTEVDESLKIALLAALEDAKKQGTLSALTDFGKKYAPQKAYIAKELAAAMHDVYARELAAYKAHAPTKDKAVVPFIEKLFAWTEAHGSNVDIKARRRPSSNLDKADKWVEKTPTFMGQVSYPTRYFDAPHAQKREAALEKDLVDKFGKAFSPELVAWKAAGEGPDPSQPTPPFTTPTLLITHQDDWSSHTYESRVPRGAFVGILFKFEVEFWIPGEAKPYKWKIDIFRPAHLDVIKDSDTPPPPGVPNEERLYEAMSKEAFTTFEDKLTQNFLPADKSDKTDKK